MKTVKSIISTVICVMFVLGIFSVCITSSATNYSTGDIVEFGSYPQSEVTDNNLALILNRQNKDWVSYFYYSGTGDEMDGEMIPDDYMRYCDVEYNGQKYRGVTFDRYRPKRTGFLTTSDDSNQDDNGYYTNNVYWFKYEPIEWRILDPSVNLVMSEKLLNALAFNDYVYYDEGTDTAYGDSDHTFYSNNYGKSSLRAWLNIDFYDLAFNSIENERNT